MEEKKQLSVSRTGKRYGFILAAVGTAYSLLATITHFSFDHEWITLTITTLIPIPVIVIALREFRVEQGYISFKQGFSLGLLVGLIYSVVVSIFNYIYVKFIDPGIIAMLKERQIMEMEKRGYDEASVEGTMKIIDILMGPEVSLFINMIINIIIITILSLIIAAVMKKDHPQMF